MPELRDLLEGAVDRPAPLDLGDLGDRVARYQRHRRIAMVAATIVVVLGLGAAGGALRGGDGDGGADGATTLPPATDGTDTTAAPSSSITTSTTAGTGATGLPACTADDIEVVPTGEGATAHTAIHAEITPAAGGQPCRIDTTATFTLRDATTDEVLAVDGNPQQVMVTGTVEVTEAVADHDPLVLSGCLPGDGFDDRSEITIELELEGLGAYSGTSLGSRCVEEGGGAVFSGLGGPSD